MLRPFRQTHLSSAYCGSFTLWLDLQVEAGVGDQVVESNSRKFLHEVLDACENLKPMERAWVPVGFDFCQVICPIDRGDSAFVAHG